MKGQKEWCFLRIWAFFVFNGAYPFLTWLKAAKRNTESCWDPPTLTVVGYEGHKLHFP